MTGLSLDQWCCICLSTWKGCSKGSMKQELIDIVFTSLLSFSFSVSFSYWLHLGGRLGSWREVRQSSLKLNFDITLSRGGWARFPRLWSYFWPSFTCVCRLLLGWKGCSIRSMKQELFDIVFTSSVVFTISSCCNLCERVCSCLLLMGWNGCRLVCLFAVAGGRAVPSGGVRQKLNRFWLSVIRSYHARVGGLAQALFRRLGFSAPPLPSLLSLLLLRLGICLSICWWGGSACSSANLGAKYLQKIMVFPFVRCVFHLISLFSM